MLSKLICFLVGHKYKEEKYFGFTKYGIGKYSCMECLKCKSIKNNEIYNFVRGI